MNLKLALAILALAGAIFFGYEVKLAWQTVSNPITQVLR